MPRAQFLLDGDAVGAWLRTRLGTRPLAVHPGWRTDLELAVKLAPRSAAGERPNRSASRAARPDRLALAGVLSSSGGTATRTARTQGFTRTGLYRRRVNAPVTHHGLDGLVTSLDRRRPKRPLFEAGVRFGSRRRGGGVAGRDPSRHQAPASRTPPRCSAIRVVARRQREQAGLNTSLAGAGEILISAEAAVAGGLDTKELERRTLELRGRDQPLDAWVATG